MVLSQTPQEVVADWSVISGSVCASREFAPPRRKLVPPPEVAPQALLPWRLMSPGHYACGS